MNQIGTTFGYGIANNQNQTWGLVPNSFKNQNQIEVLTKNMVPVVRFKEFLSSWRNLSFFVTFFSVFHFFKISCSKKCCKFPKWSVSSFVQKFHIQKIIHHWTLTSNFKLSSGAPPQASSINFTPNINLFCLE
jgi:hypothetical protein